MKSVDARVPFFAADLVSRGLFKLPPHVKWSPAVAVTSWYRRAAVLGHGEACRRLGARWIRGQGAPKSVRQGLSALRRAGGLGEISAWETLGDIYREGSAEDLPVDLEQAEAAYLAGAKASLAGPAPSALGGRLCAKLGATLLGRGKLKEGIGWLERGVELKAPLAEIGYGGCLLSGRGVKPNPARGLALLESHAASYVLACEALELAYRNGVGVKADPERAQSYRDQAAALLAAGAERWPAAHPR